MTFQGAHRLGCIGGRAATSVTLNVDIASSSELLPRLGNDDWEALEPERNHKNSMKMKIRGLVLSDGSILRTQFALSLPPTAKKTVIYHCLQVLQLSCSAV